MGYSKLRSAIQRASTEAEKQAEAIETCPMTYTREDAIKNAAAWLRTAAEHDLEKKPNDQ